MNRRNFFKALGVGVAGLCGLKALSAMASEPTFKGVPLKWGDGKPKHLVDTGHGLANVEVASEPVLFVGGPLHGQVSNWQAGEPVYGYCRSWAFRGENGGLISGETDVEYRRYGRCFAIVDGTDMTDAARFARQVRSARSDAVILNQEAYQRWDCLTYAKRLRMVAEGRA